MTWLYRVHFMNKAQCGIFKIFLPSRFYVKLSFFSFGSPKNLQLNQTILDQGFQGKSSSIPTSKSSNMSIALRAKIHPGPRNLRFVAITIPRPSRFWWPFNLGQLVLSPGSGWTWSQEIWFLFVNFTPTLDENCKGQVQGNSIKNQGFRMHKGCNEGRN